MVLGSSPIGEDSSLLVLSTTSLYRLQQVNNESHGVEVTCVMWNIVEMYDKSRASSSYEL